MTHELRTENVADSDRFLRAVELTETDPQTFDRAFTAMPQYVPWPKAYGGDLVAQSAAAAIRTVETDRTLHSLHGSFLRPVDVGVPVRYEVELLRDGRGFSTRHVRGFQHDKVAFLSTASFQVPAGGVRYAPPAPSVVPPEGLPSTAESLDDLEGPAADYWAHGRSFDHRHESRPLYQSNEGKQAPHQAIWVRAFAELPDDPILHQIAISYLCDYSILKPSLRALNAHWMTPGLTTASLDHSMWFHGGARADEWLLYVQESAGVQSSRGLNVGRFYARDGALIASVAQEGLLRLP